MKSTFGGCQEDVQLEELSNRTTRAVLIYLDDELTRELDMTREQVVAAIKSIVSKDVESSWKVHLLLFSHLNLIPEEQKEGLTPPAAALPALRRLLRRDLPITYSFYIEIVNGCGLDLIFLETLILATDSSDPLLQEYCGKMYSEAVNRTYRSLAEVRGTREEVQRPIQHQCLMHLLVITKMCARLRCQSVFDTFKTILDHLRKEVALSNLWKLQTIIRLVGSHLVEIEDFSGNSAITELLDNLDFCPLAGLVLEPSENWKFLQRLFRPSTYTDDNDQGAAKAVIEEVIAPLVDCLFRIEFPVLEEDSDVDGLQAVIEPGSTLKLAMKSKNMHDFQYVGDCAYLVQLLLKRSTPHPLIQELRMHPVYLQIQLVCHYLEKFKSRPDFEGAFGNEKVDFERFCSYLKTKVILRHELPLWHAKFFTFDEAFSNDSWYDVGEEIVAPRVSREVGLQQINNILDVYKNNIPDRAKRLIIRFSTSKELLKIFPEVVVTILENKPVDRLMTQVFQGELNGFCTKLITADFSSLGDGTIGEEHMKTILSVMLQNPLLAGTALLHRSIRLPSTLQRDLLNKLNPFWRLPHNNEYLLDDCVRNLIFICSKETGSLKPFEDFLPNLLRNEHLSYVRHHGLLIEALVVSFLRRSNDEISRLLMMYRNCGKIVHCTELPVTKREDFLKLYHYNLEAFIQFSFLDDWKDNIGPLVRGELIGAHEEFPGGHTAIFELFEKNVNLITLVSLTDLVILYTRIPPLRRVVEDFVQKKKPESLDLDIMMLELVIRNSSQREWFSILDILFIICLRKYSSKERLMKWLRFVSSIMLLDGSIQIPRKKIGEPEEADNDRQSLNQNAFVVYQEFGKSLVRYLLHHGSPASQEFQANPEAKFHLTHVLLSAVVLFPDEPKYLPGKRAIFPSLFQVMKYVNGEKLETALKKKYLLLMLALQQDYSGRRSEFLPMIDTMFDYVAGKLSNE